MQRAHKIRLNPTPDQANYFWRASGTARFVYNWALERWKQNRAAGVHMSFADLKKEFNAIKRQQFPFVYEVTKCAAEHEFSNLSQAFANYWRMKRERKLPKLRRPRKDGEEAGFPRFKSKKRDTPSFYLSNDKFSVEGHAITIPKLGRMNMTEPLRLEGKILSAIVSYRAGWWFVSITVELPDPHYQRDNRITGIDVGLKTFAVASTGEVFENQKHLARSLAKLRRFQKAQSRKVEGSRNWQKVKERVAKTYYKVACQRQDRQHKVSTALAQTYTYIGMEDLNIKGLVKNRKLARSLSDAAFSAFKRYLSYKAEQWSGKVIEVGRFFASSRLCHVCGYKNVDLRLVDREWTCPDCRTWHERDVNAARNIHQEAQRMLMASR